MISMIREIEKEPNICGKYNRKYGFGFIMTQLLLEFL
jgi:hypothetical protein